LPWSNFGSVANPLSCPSHRLAGRVYRPSNLNGFQTSQPVRSLFFAQSNRPSLRQKVGFGVLILANQVLAVLVFLCVEAREERQMVKWRTRCSGSDPSRGNVAAIKRRFAPISIKRAAMRLAAPGPSAGRHFRQSTAVALDRVVEIGHSSNLSWLLYQNGSQMAAFWANAAVN